MTKEKKLYELEFVINKLPPILSNGSHMHWRVVAGIKKNWKVYTLNACYAKRPESPLKKAKVEFIRHSSREPDSDNLAASFKSIRDGLVMAGILIDDKPSVLKAVYKWKKSHPKNGFVEIKIKERK